MSLPRLQRDSVLQSCGQVPNQWLLRIILIIGNVRLQCTDGGIYVYYYHPCSRLATDTTMRRLTSHDCGPVDLRWCVSVHACVCVRRVRWRWEWQLENSLQCHPALYHSNEGWTAARVLMILMSELKSDLRWQKKELVWSLESPSAWFESRGTLIRIDMDSVDTAAELWEVLWWHDVPPGHFAKAVNDCL